LVHLDIDAAGFTFHAVASGPVTGEPVVLLHGFPETSHEWRHQLPALADAGYRAVAFDQRGYSPRARPADVADYRVPILVGDVLAVADALGFETFHLVAHDWGAIIAWQVAGHHGHRLRSLTAISVPHPKAFYAAISGNAEQKERSQYMRFFQEEGAAEDALLANDAVGLRAMYAGLPADAVDTYVAVLGERAALTAALNYYRTMDRTLATEIGPVEVPALLVWGDEDPAVARPGIEGTAAHVDGPFRLEILAGAGHWIPELQAETLNRLLMEHLAGARAS
jgi:pimeloyl-ACP methyl ester carboxylesterase